jgi:hypothetical protein
MSLNSSCEIVTDTMEFSQLAAEHFATESRNILLAQASDSDVSGDSDSGSDVSDGSDDSDSGTSSDSESQGNGLAQLGKAEEEKPCEK